jgi:O-antigen/teichoic acid export membrane protein
MVTNMSSRRIGCEELQGIPMSILRRRLLSGSAWAFGGRVVTALAVLTVNALLARLLTPQDVGAYLLAFSLVSVGALLGSLGLNQAVVRFVAQTYGLNRFGQTRRVVGIVLALGALGASGVALAYLLFGHLVGNELFHSPALAAVTGLVAVWAMIIAMQTLLAETFRGFDDIRLATLFGGLGLVTWALLAACLGLLWLLEGDTTLATVILLAIGSSFASVLAAGWLLLGKTTSLPREPEQQDELGVREILNVAWPLLLVNLTLFILTQADLWIVGAFQAQEEVAVYGAAARVVTLVVMPLVVVNAVVPPLIAKSYVQGKKADLERILRATATVASIPAFLALLGFVTFSGPLLGLIYGSYYRQGAAVIALLSVGQFVNVWVGSCGYMLIMTGHQTTAMTITVASGTVTIAAALTVVGSYGIIGVAAATSTGVALHNVSMWLMARHKTAVWTHVGVREVSSLLRGMVR